MEEYAENAPLRPRTVYTGPGPKTVMSLPAADVPEPRPALQPVTSRE
jgi:hypothetical protein